MDNSSPLFFILNLSDGSLASSMYRANLGETNMLITDMKISETGDIIILLIKHNSGFHKIEYNTTSNVFSSSYSASTVQANFVTFLNDYFYYGGVLKSTGEPHISKLLGNGETVSNPTLTLTTSTSTFTVDSSGYSIVTDSSVSLSATTISVPVDQILSIIDIGSIVISATGTYISDIAFPSGLDEVIRVQAGKSLTVTYICSISGVTSITTSLMNPPTGTYPSWISLTPDGTGLQMNTPEYIPGADTYYLSIRSATLSQIIDKALQIVLYVCEVAN